jgi:hypothetical protein
VKEERPNASENLPRGFFLLFIDWCPKRPVGYFYPTGFQSGRLEGFGSRDSNYFRARTRASDASREIVER